MPHGSCSASADAHELPLCVGEPPRVPTPLWGRLPEEGLSYADPKLKLSPSGRGGWQRKHILRQHSSAPRSLCK